MGAASLNWEPSRPGKATCSLVIRDFCFPVSKYTALLLEIADVLTRGQLVHSDHLLTPGPAVPTKAQEGGVPVLDGTVSQGHGDSRHTSCQSSAFKRVCAKWKGKLERAGVSINMNHFSSPETHYSISLTVPNTTCFELRVLFVYILFIYF